MNNEEKKYYYGFTELKRVGESNIAISKNGNMVINIKTRKFYSIYTPKSHCGYKMIGAKGLTGNTCYIHKLVYEAWCGEIPEGYEIHHIDGNCNNNDADNLIALTPAVHAKVHAIMRRENSEVALNNLLMTIFKTKMSA